MRIVGAAADEAGLGLDLGVPARIHPGDHALDLGHDFGADAVAGEQQKFVCHALRASCVRAWSRKLRDLSDKATRQRRRGPGGLPNGRRKC